MKALLIALLAYLTILISTDQPTRIIDSPDKQSTVVLASARILRVVDGDTVKVFLDNEQQTVRIIGINTPETVDPRKEVECFGKEASEMANLLLPVGSEIKLQNDTTQGDRDRYGRLLRYLYMADDKDYGKEMISLGYANEYTYDNPYAFQKKYKEAESEAKNSRRGLWSENSCPTEVKDL